MLTGSGGYLSSIRYNVLTAASTSAQGKKLNVGSVFYHAYTDQFRPIGHLILATLPST